MNRDGRHESCSCHRHGFAQWELERFAPSRCSQRQRQSRRCPLVLPKVEVFIYQSHLFALQPRPSGYPPERSSGMTNKYIPLFSLIVALSITAVSESAYAFVISVTDPNVTHTVTAGGFTTTLDPDTHTALAVGATQAIRDLYAADYPGFTYAAAGAARTGTLTISQLDAFQDGSQGGLDIVASFAGDPAPHIYRWLQYIDLNPISPAFRGATTSPFTDPPPLDRDDTLPFYETNAERNTEGVGYVTGGNINNNPRFWDGPRVNDSRAPVTMHLNLFLADFDSNTNTVTIYDGVQYGFRITSVPEPSTPALLMLGILGILALRRKTLA